MSRALSSVYAVGASVFRAIGAPTAAPIVTKFGQQMLLVICSKAIAPHLRSEAVLRPKSRSNVIFTTWFNSYRWPEEGREERVDIEPGKSGKPNCGSTRGLMARWYHYVGEKRRIVSGSVRFKSKNERAGSDPDADGRQGLLGECEVRHQLRVEQRSSPQVGGLISLKIIGESYSNLSNDACLC